MPPALLLALHGIPVDEQHMPASSVPPPQTPMEPMEYLSRSWSVSAKEISKALLLKGGSKRSFFAPAHTLLPPHTAAIPEMETSYELVAAPVTSIQHIQHQHLDATGRSSISCHRHSNSVTRWYFQHKETAKHGRKEKARADRAQAHAMVSVAQVSAAVAAITAAASCDDQDSKIAAAMASATKLLASHCAEAAQLAGAGHEQVSSAVRSAVGVAGPGDLMTLTAAAATALRGAAALKKRVQREARSNASVIPYAKAPLSWSPDIWCKEGKLLKRTRKGDLHKRRVSIYINKRSQVILKLKSKHIGGALSKNNKSVIYGVYSELPEWTEPGKCLPETCCFGLSTAQGLIEFKCESSTSKQSWVHGVQNLLQQVDVADQVGHRLETLKLNWCS